jgi:cysteinyl-tRNA synthetase
VRWQEETSRDNGGLAWKKKFDKAINDDLNAPKALGIVFEMLKDKKIKAVTKRDLLAVFDTVLDLNILPQITQNEPVLKKVQEMLEKYEQFRGNKQFMQSDALRKEIEALGYEVRDAEKGSHLVKKFF